MLLQSLKGNLNGMKAKVHYGYRTHMMNPIHHLERHYTGQK